MRHSYSVSAATSTARLPGHSIPRSGQRPIGSPSSTIGAFRSHGWLSDVAARSHQTSSTDAQASPTDDNRGRRYHFVVRRGALVLDTGRPDRVGNRSGGGSAGGRVGGAGG